MGRHNNGRTLWKTENKSNKLDILQKRCERQQNIAKHFKRPCKRAQELPALLSPPNQTFVWEICLVLSIFSIRNLKDFQSGCHCLEEAVLGRTVVACKGQNILIPCCSWMLWMGVFPLIECASDSMAVSSGLALGTRLCSAAWLQGNCTLYCHYEFPVGCSFPSFYISTLCWPWCILWESTIQVVLHVISLVSPLLWVKSKYGAVPSAKWLSQFPFLPKRACEEPRPGCLHQIADCL